MKRSECKMERRDSLRRLKNSKGWRCDVVREFMLGLEVLDETWHQLHPDERARMLELSGLDDDLTGQQFKLMYTVARKVEEELRAQVRTEARIGVKRCTPIVISHQKRLS